MFTKNDKEIAYIDISHEIDSQQQLLIISLYVILAFSVFSYFVSRWFVISSLKGLKKLTKFVESIHFDNLDQKIDLPGPKKDELKIIANGINEAIFRLGEQANALKDFVRNASHELKTPLMMINSEADLALKSQKYVSGLNNIKKYLKQLDHLIEHLLLITRLDSGVVFAKEEVDIIPLIRNHLNLLQEQYKDKEITVTPNIPATFVTKVHEGVFNIIIRNLLDNALKYTNKGGEITVTLEKKLLSIKDNGIGISEKNLNNIRERFWKVDDSRSGDEYSFGLGLHLVKKLCENQNFKIYVESIEGEGTTFSVKL